MGNKYSQIITEKFPTNMFTVGLRQPDIIQILNADLEIVEAVLDAIETNWSWGIKNERKIRFGLEFKLYNNPFSNDSMGLDKLTQLNSTIVDILVRILNKGYDILSSGYIIKSYERSMWIFRKSVNSTSSSVTITNASITSMIFEGWNKLILNNIDEDCRESISQIVSKIPKINVTSIQYTNKQIVIEFDGQPWDSHKSNSFYSPVVLLHTLRDIMSCNYNFLCKAHITGFSDSLFFIKQSIDLFNLHDLFVLSFNHIDQIRTYDASSTVIQQISKIVKENWQKGIKNDVIQGSVWSLSLNGSPWCVQDWDKDSCFSSRLMVVNIIKQLEKDGWEIITGLKFYRSQYDRNMFIMRKVTNDFARNTQFFTVTPHDADRLSLTNFPEQILKGISDNLLQHWSRGTKQDSYENGCYEFVLEGKPWLMQDDNGDVNSEGVGFFCWITELILENDCTLLTTVDICSTTSYGPVEYMFEKFIN